MNIDVKNMNDYVVVSVEGRLDTTQSDNFEKNMLDLVTAGKNKIIIDCSKLEYISSSGLRVFLIMQKKMMTSSGQLRICCLQPAIREIFEISGFTMIFSIFTNIHDALKA